MEKINFTDGHLLTSDDLNNMQDNTEKAIDEKPSTPAGGTTGQVLAKASDADNDTEWVDNESGDSMPVNSVIAFEGDTIPEGYEEVNNPNAYSTEEVKTNEVWIDGKPIYRKTLQFNTASTTGWWSLVSYNTLNIETIVKDDTYMFYNNSKYRLPYYETEEYNCLIKFNLDYIIVFTSDGFLSRPVISTIYYTKTTD